MLKDSCKLSEYEAASFVQTQKDYFGHHSEFVVSKNNSLNFTINHFAGKVKYDGSRLLDKAKEALSKNVFDCLQKRQDIFIADLFTNIPVCSLKTLIIIITIKKITYFKLIIFFF